MAWTNVKIANVSTSTTAVAYPSRLRAIYIFNAAAAASVRTVTVKDGGTTGAILFQVDVPAATAITMDHFSDAGIRAAIGIWFDPSGTSVNAALFYD